MVIECLTITLYQENENSHQILASKTHVHLLLFQLAVCETVVQPEIKERLFPVPFESDVQTCR